MKQSKWNEKINKRRRQRTNTTDVSFVSELALIVPAKMIKCKGGAQPQDKAILLGIFTILCATKKQEYFW